MIARPVYIEMLSRATKRSPVTALLGPRQCGKTTLAKVFGEGKKALYFDLESQADARRLDNPEFVLGSLTGLVIIDEIQTMPHLFNVLRVLVDRPDNKKRFLILGSASPDVIRNVSESLAGRVEFVELSGFDLNETGTETWQKLWLRGGFPRSYLARTEGDSFVWRQGFIRTFLERDIPQLGITIPSTTMRRFWMMLAHYHGQTWNASELSRSMGLSDKTVRSYLDILTGTFMVRQLQPWHENIGKRQVKAPKIYLRDSGILHSLLGLTDRSTLLAHPRVGASWEGFAIEQVLMTMKGVDAFFWATHSGASVDLLFQHKGKRYGVEVKFNEAPVVNRSMRIAIQDLSLERLWIICPVQNSYLIEENVTVLSVKDIPQMVKAIFY